MLEEGRGVATPPPSYKRKSWFNIINSSSGKRGHFAITSSIFTQLMGPTCEPTVLRTENMFEHKEQNQLEEQFIICS